MDEKQEILYDIADAIGAPRRPTSKGSTEPKAALVDIVEKLGLDIDTRAPKPVLARKIAEAGGVYWDETCDSTGTASGGGSTITRTGLLRLREAVHNLRGT